MKVCLWKQIVYLMAKSDVITFCVGLIIMLFFGELIFVVAYFQGRLIY